MRLWKFALLASICGVVGLNTACLTEAAFTEQSDQAICDLNFLCLDAVILEFYEWDDVQDCLDERAADAAAEQTTMDVCTFDSDAAQECLDELAAVSCEDYRENLGFESCADTCE